jgi:uncharacterized protein YkwD
MPLPRRLSMVLVSTVAVLATSAQARAQQPCRGASRTPSGATATRARAVVVCLINRERAARGLAALRDHPRLRAAAGSYARLMVADDFFAHVSPDGSTLRTRAASAGYMHAQSFALGEDIAAGSGTLGAPKAIVAAWMASAGHRRNVLDSGFRDVGVGVAVDAGGMATYVADFGSQR